MSKVALRLPVRESAVSVGDATLIERIGGGDMGALGGLFDRYHADVRRVIARLGVSEGDLDDLVQLTFLDVMQSATKYDGRMSAKPWLSGMAVMIVRRHRRSWVRHLRRLAAWGNESRDEMDTETPEKSAATRQSARRVQKAMTGLSEKKREVLVLVALEGLSGEEVAAALNIPVATVWTRLHHARNELRAALELEAS